MAMRKGRAVALTDPNLHAAVPFYQAATAARAGEGRRQPALRRWWPRRHLGALHLTKERPTMNLDQKTILDLAEHLENAELTVRDVTMRSLGTVSSTMASEW